MLAATSTGQSDRVHRNLRPDDAPGDPVASGGQSARHHRGEHHGYAAKQLSQPGKRRIRPSGLGLGHLLLRRCARDFHLDLQVHFLQGRLEVPLLPIAAFDESQQAAPP